MIHETACKWASMLVERGGNRDNFDVLVYGFECFLNEVIATGLVFAIAFIIGKPLEMLVWQVFWLPFRLNLGGHHAANHFWCILYSTALAVGCVLLVPLLLPFSWIIWIEIAISLMIAFLVAPVIHPNRLVSEERIAKFKKAGRIICLVESIIILLLSFFAPVWLAQTAAIGMFTAAILCLVGKFTTPKATTS